MGKLRRKLEPLLRRVFHLYWRFARGMTLGVRAVVLDSDNKVFLVKHSYVAGWHLPGGGVEVGETFMEALMRELAEEGRIVPSGAPELHGLFFNRHVSIGIRPSITSAIRSNVPGVVSSGSAPTSKKPQATISRFGSGNRS